MTLVKSIIMCCKGGGNIKGAQNYKYKICQKCCSFMPYMCKNMGYS